MRKAISKKVRFEVFKRDSFTCQYCGLSAPEVILHLDHIAPVAGGGENDILNLVTSCVDCNLGKGARALDDKSAIAKQKAQLDELNRRREQLEMMLSWREGLAEIDQDEVAAVADHFSEQTNTYLNDFGLKEAKKWIKRYGIAKTLEALDAGLGTYYKGGDPDDLEENRRLAGLAFNFIPKIIASQARNADKPWMKDVYYIRAIVRNRHHCNDRIAADLIEEAIHAGASVEDLKDWAKRSRSWTNWRTEMEEWIDTLQDEAR